MSDYKSIEAGSRGFPACSLCTTYDLSWTTSVSTIKINEDLQFGTDASQNMSIGPLKYGNYFKLSGKDPYSIKLHILISDDV